jgi:E1A-binding protein p400
MRKFVFIVHLFKYWKITDLTIINLSIQSSSGGTEEKAAIGALESALAQAEDETDVAAAKVAKAEAAAELAEFDENIPIEQQEGQELSKAEMELNALMQQVSFQ